MLSHGVAVEQWLSLACSCACAIGHSACSSIDLIYVCMSFATFNRLISVCMCYTGSDTYTYTLPITPTSYTNSSECWLLLVRLSYTVQAGWNYVPLGAVGIHPQYYYHFLTSPGWLLLLYLRCSLMPPITRYLANGAHWRSGRQNVRHLHRGIYQTYNVTLSRVCTARRGRDWDPSEVVGPCTLPSKHFQVPFGAGLVLILKAHEKLWKRGRGQAPAIFM